MAAPVRKVFRSLSWAGLVTVATGGAGIGLGRVWADGTPDLVRRVAPWVQLGSGAMFLWAVLALLGCG